MDDYKDEPRFPRFLEERHRETVAFLTEHAELTEVIDTLLLVQRALTFGVAAKHGSKSVAVTHAALMWQVAADYYKQSLVHILARELDAAFALLRMAVELARDCYVIGKNKNLLELWMSREDDLNSASKYRKVFKFDRSNSAGRAAFGLYKFCSRFGVHGHMTSLMQARRTIETDANMVVIDSDIRAIFTGLQIWLRAYFPVHALFCDSFQLSADAAWEPYAHFLELIGSLDPVLGAVDKMAGGEPDLLGGA